MNFEDDTSPSLRGQLLLADPSLRNDTFCRTVLLITTHGTDVGAHGYVLNRPLGQSVGELLPGAEFGPLAEIPVFIGGPVEPEQLMFASFVWDKNQEIIRWETHLDTDEAIARLEAGRLVRGFAGYSGWSSGQLEGELKRRSWIACAAKCTVLRSQHVETLWRDILSELGPFYRLIAHSPEDPSLN